MGKPPRDVFLIQLNEARAEWQESERCRRQMIPMMWRARQRLIPTSRALPAWRKSRWLRQLYASLTIERV